VRGGTEGVGRATTETVAVASVAVLVADFFLTKLLLLVLA
jgi:phospholipid/cholesterol/gamma-HCH transport system permease protein